MRVFYGGLWSRRLCFCESVRISWWIHSIWFSFMIGSPLVPAPCRPSAWLPHCISAQHRGPAWSNLPKFARAPGSVCAQWWLPISALSSWADPSFLWRREKACCWRRWGLRFWSPFRAFLFYLNYIILRITAMIYMRDRHLKKQKDSKDDPSARHYLD